MERYIGLDVHGASSTFVVLGPNGKQLKTAVVSRADRNSSCKRGAAYSGCQRMRLAPNGEICLDLPFRRRRNSKLDPGPICPFSSQLQGGLGCETWHQGGSTAPVPNTTCALTVASWA